MKKRTTLLLLVLVFGMFLTTSAETWAAEPVTINFWHSMGSGVNGQAVKDLVKRFNETNGQDITVVETYQGNYNDCSAKIMQSIAAGTNPEVAMLDRGLVPQYAPYGVLADMLPFAERDGFDIDDFVPGLMEFSWIDGALVSLPFNRSTPVLYYNKAAFAEVGLDPERPPQTWDELFEYAGKLTTVENGETTRYGFSMVIDTGWFLCAMVGQQGGRTIDESGEKVLYIEDGTALKALEFWRKLADSGYYRIPATTSAGTVMMQDFYQGKLAMMYQSTGNMSGILKNTEGMGAFDVGVAFLAGEKQREVPTGGANVVMFDNFSDRQKEAAWEFIKFATSPEEAALFSVATGYVPTRYAAVESEVIKELWAEHPQYEVAFNQLEFARDTWGSPYWWEFNSMVNKVVSRLIQDRSITPQQAVDQIAEEASWLFPGNM